MLKTYTADFSGAKIALLIHKKVLTILRDDLPNIPYPNMWDLPGGGKENKETPFECLKREVFEELNIIISEKEIIWSKFYKGNIRPDTLSFFAVALLEDKILNDIRFGKEGQGYALMDIDDFLTNENVILSLRNRLKEYMDRLKNS